MSVKKPKFEYHYRDAQAAWDADFVCAPVLDLLKQFSPKKVLEIGCGNGIFANRMADEGFQVTAMDNSRSGIRAAQKGFPRVKFSVGSVYEPTSFKTAKWDSIVAVEVIEHLERPAKMLENAFHALREGGMLVITTPSHSYFKNLMISLTNGWDHHFGVDFEGGHIKFFSERTLGKMVARAGFERIHCRGVGRLPLVRKSILLTAFKPYKS